MHPFGGLPENLAGFCAALRSDHGFRIGPGELLDAARALGVVNLADQRAVRDALRTVLAGTRDDAAVFDDAFNRYFFPSPLVDRRDRSAAAVPEPGASPDGGEQATKSRPGSPVDEADGRAESADRTTTSAEAGDGDEGALLMRAAYSPMAAESSDAPLVVEATDPWVQAARALVRRVHLGLSRRWRPATRGRRFNFRGTLRASLQTGGEPLEPRWLGRPRRVPRFVLLIDGSRSMSEHANTALRVASALARATTRIEVFVFSTSIRRVTRDLRSHAGHAAYRLPRLSYAWGGGTAIGTCFADFLRRFGERLIDRATLVIVVSDGLDVGESATLLAAMQALSRRAAGIVWLNPLAATPGYEPTALGMRTAIPFVTTFDSVTDLASFIRLSRVVRVRA